MKKSLIIFSLFFLIIGTTLKAQDSVSVSKPTFHKVEFGFRLMPTLSSVDMNVSSGGTVKGQATFGYGIGALLGFNLSNHIGVEADIIYNSLSQKYNSLFFPTKPSIF